MQDLNMVIVEGRAVRDAQQAATRSGAAVTNFALATNRYWRQDGEMKEDTTFLDVACFGKTAEWAAEISKGTKVRVLGRLQQDRWEKDGQTHSKIKIVADRVQVQRERQEQQAPSGESIGFDDDLPF